MSRHKQLKENKIPEVQFVGDEDVLEHIIDKREGVKAGKDAVQTLVNIKKYKKDLNLEGGAEEVLSEQNYVEALGNDSKDSSRNGTIGGGGQVYAFQTVKRGNKMAQLATELARTPGKSVTFDASDDLPEVTTPPRSSRKKQKVKKTPSRGKNDFISTTPHRLRKRLTAPNLRSESESDYSPSNSEEETNEEEEQEDRTVKSPVDQKTQGKVVGLSKTPAKKSKMAPISNLVEEYFEAHKNSKVLTSDRTLQKLQAPKLDQETLSQLLNKSSTAFDTELKKLNGEHERLFHKWMLLLRLGFSIVLYGLGSKKCLLEKFRSVMLQEMVHVVVNGFFPSITIKSILNSITEEVLDHHGTFRSPLDQLDFIVESFNKDSSMQLFLIIHNIDGQMLRGEKTQLILGQLASIPNIYLIASIDHINAPLMWDHSKLSFFNWLWYETTTYQPYSEETSYENSLLMQQSGALALSSLTHVLRSLTPNARGIFRLLVEFQLENKDNPNYTGLSFQDFYQRCREGFLVNSDLTLRAQLTEFRDHKLIRTKKGVDGVEYLLIPIDNATLSDFLEKEEEDF
ncbi:origin recognition complex subunit 2 [Protopterus annectens]|uniref:origin recognition complex subunit 2 n=1 Tax=Protopterus annectens TaxID=7888 RepID=UPI001CFB4326|nr:origin recognition complex subunit 2 [Protopterus annectens]